jgi:hypothetical protein
MNYNRPPAAPAGLTYPILQETINLSNADFTKLNTSPVVILPNQSNYICPLNITIQYINTGTGLNGQYFFGFESQLSASNGNSSFLAVDTTIAGASANNTWTIATRFAFPASWDSNTDMNEPLIIWNVTDEALLTYSKFYVIITYLRIPNL